MILSSARVGPRRLGSTPQVLRQGSGRQIHEVERPPKEDENDQDIDQVDDRQKVAGCVDRQSLPRDDLGWRAVMGGHSVLNAFGRQP